MRVIGFVGSPRKGSNTDTLVKQILSGAASRGAYTTTYYLNDLNISGCQACMTCKGQLKSCRQEDAMQEIYSEMIRADGIVIGSPVYMGYITGQTKIFLDRLYAFYNPDMSSRLPLGKKAVLVISQGYDDDKAYNQALGGVEHTLKSLGMEVLPKLVAAGIKDVTADRNLMEKAKAIGLQLIS